MTDTQIDRILSENEILPSSGFVSSVMEAVRLEATAPPAIPFPWKRAMPAAVLGAVALVLLIAVTGSAIRSLGSMPASNVPAAMPAPYLFSMSQGTLHSAWTWSALALVAAFISVALSLRMAGGES